MQLTDGSAAVTAGGDCLQAESLVWVTDGTYTLTSNGTAVDAETGETSSSKGIKCSGDVEIAGGTLTIDAAEDGVNCGGAMEIQDGEMTVSSAEDGIQADGDLTISGGTVQVTTTGEVAASAQDDFQPGNFGGGTPPSGEMPLEMHPPEIRRSCRTARPLAAAIRPAEMHLPAMFPDRTGRMPTPKTLTSSRRQPFRRIPLRHL